MRKAIVLLILIMTFLSGLASAYAITDKDIDFYKLFENHGSIMMLIDPQTGEIRHVNKAASDYYGYSVEELRSMKISDINILSENEVIKEMQAAVAERREHFIFRHRLASGEIRTVEVYSCPHATGDKTMLFSTVYDITEKVQLAEKNKILVISLLVILIVVITIIGFFTLILLRNKKRLVESNDLLKETNRLLHEKQYSLEEQNATIEELNSQLENDNERIQQQKEVLQAIIDSFGAGIIMVDMEGNISFINEAWRDLFNYLDISDGLNRKFYTGNMGYDTKAFFHKMMTGIENGNETVDKLIELTKDKESRLFVDLEQTKPVRRFLNLYSNPCISYKNHSFGRVFVFRDISHQKEVERLKMDLINTVSHELRTPMSSVLGFSELLLTRKLSEERSMEYIKTINTEAKRLTNLINDFLDMQRMESGRQIFNKKLNSVDDIIKEAIRLFDGEDNKYRIIYKNEMDSLSLIYCDKDKILQVMANILSNAVKYSPEGGEIHIVLTGDSERIKVTVKDHGLGIPENAMDKLFSRFYRVDSDDRRNIGGTGLGLAISKEIIRAHGGEIGVDSVYGKGSTFYFILPHTDGNIVEKTEDDAGSEGNDERRIIEEDKGSMESDIKDISMNYENTADEILDILKSKGINARHTERSGNMLIITLEG